MEDWQKVYIKSNLSSLLNNTLVNAMLLAILEEEDVLSDIEVAQIVAKQTNHEQAKLLYNILLTKSNGYYTLIKALTETKQSGATKLLFHPSENISNLKVHFQGRTDQLNNLLNTEQISDIQTWLRQNAFTKEQVKTLENVLKHEAGLDLLRDTIPKSYTGYIPRYLSRRLDVSAELFKETCSDIFVFKQIERAQLRKFVPTEYAIESSTSQLLSSKITARFILLRSESDWKRICSRVKVPVHLLKYDKDTETFVLEKSSGTSTLLRHHLQDACHKECMSEDVFVNKVLSEAVKGVCICDTPGMGKSDLLASLARKVGDCCPESIVAYIQLRDFKVEETCANLHLKILEHIATSPMASQILYQLLQNETTKFELFFDGLDEVHEKKLEGITTFLYQVGESMPNARILVTSRPVVCNELEKTIGAIAYDILPFDVQTQKNYLTKFWKNENNSSDIDKLKQYAEFCLENVKSNLTENERKITGVPLLCRLIAQVYSEKAAVFADKNRNISVKLVSNFANSLSEIYSKFIVRQLGESKCNFACMYKDKKAVCDSSCHVRNFHVQKALALVCPTLSKELSLYFNIEYSQYNRAQNLSPGLLELNPVSHHFEFAHRTIAEYLVAEFFSKSLFMSVETFQSTNITQRKLVLLQNSAYSEIFGFDSDLSMEQLCEKKRILGQNVVAYFFNTFLTESYNSSGQLSMAAFIPTRTLFYCTVEGCLKHNYEALLDMILGKGTGNNLIHYELPNLTSVLQFWFDFPCNALEVFALVLMLPGAAIADAYDSLYVLFDGRCLDSSEAAYTLVRIAAENCSARVVEKVCKLFGRLFGRELLKMCQDLDESPTLLQIAVKRADYEMVVFFLKFIPPRNQGLLYICLENTCFEDNELIDKRLDIARLLLLKNADLLNETYIENGVEKECKSLAENLHFKAIEFLDEQGARLNASKANGLWSKWSKVLYTTGIYKLIEEFVEFRHLLSLMSQILLCMLCSVIFFAIVSVVARDAATNATVVNVNKR